mgnify:CR=1 FL=1
MVRDRRKLLLALAIADQNPGCRVREPGAGCVWAVVVVVTLLVVAGRCA